MKNANRTTVLLAVAALIAVAGLAYPKAGLIKVFAAAGPGEVLNPDVEGLVGMNFHDSPDSRTEGQVQVRGLEPGFPDGVARLARGQQVAGTLEPRLAALGVAQVEGDAALLVAQFHTPGEVVTLVGPGDVARVEIMAQW